MIRTRINLQPRLINGRMSRSYFARGYLHALYLARCDSRLRQPISRSVGYTLFHYFPVRRKHPAFHGRPYLRRSQTDTMTVCWSYQDNMGEYQSGLIHFLVEISDDDGTVMISHDLDDDEIAAIRAEAAEYNHE